jgi:transcription initiation factor TFIIIB Brf1 subunit/transcription initiation factor TFIIB
MDNLKKLEMKGCKTFVCPNLSIMEDRCKELNINTGTIEKSKSMAIEFFKKTYHKPHYSSARHVIPSIVYIVCMLEGEKRSKKEIAKAFGGSHVTLKKWQIYVMKTMGIKELKLYRKSKIIEFDSDAQFCELDKEGKMLQLKDCTIETAKHLMSKFFKIESFAHHYPHIRQLRSAFIYTASVVEDDRIRQIEICQVLGTPEGTISSWYSKILKVLGLKIISNNRRTITVLEGHYDS